jgi:glycosyltransferase involved in cell wall biosynthesis
MTMRVLMVHGRYLIRGGEDEVFEAEQRLLRAAGVEVATHEEDNRLVESQGRLRTALDTVWSRRVYRAIRARLKAEPADLVHVHNFFPLISPAVYHAARAEGAAVVQTLHNYRLLCPAGIFQRDGRICEDCLGRRVAWPAVAHGCYRGSRAGSAAVAAMQAGHWLLGSWQRKVDLYIALTEFGRLKFIEGGLPAEQIAVKPNFVEPDPGIGQGGGDFALYVGRLNREKGVPQILAAWRRLGSRLPLKIMGDGPLADEVAAAAAELPGVSYLGRQPLGAVLDAMGEARCFVLASTWYEGFPLVISECYARGLPLVASAIGPIPDVVEDGRTGLLFRPGDVDDLVAKVEALLAAPERLAGMRAAARAVFEARYTAAVNQALLLELYGRARAARQAAA